MKHLITAAIAAIALVSHGIDSQIVTNASPFDAWSEISCNGYTTAYISGVDGGPFVLMSKEYFDGIVDRVKFFEKVARREWKKQHETLGGRMDWHGNKVATRVDDKTGEVVEEYEDGYCFVKKMQKRTYLTNDVNNASRKAQPDRMSVLPPRLKEVIAARKIARSTTNEVSVTIKGGVR